MYLILQLPLDREPGMKKSKVWWIVWQVRLKVGRGRGVRRGERQAQVGPCCEGALQRQGRFQQTETAMLGPRLLRTQERLPWKKSGLLLLSILHPFSAYMWLPFTLNVGYSESGTLCRASSWQFPKVKSLNPDPGICEHQLTELP